MTVAITDNRTLVDNANQLTDWDSPVAGESPALFSAEPSPREASDCIGIVVSTQTSDLVHTLATATSMTNELVYVWIYAQADLDTYQNGGISIAIGDAADLTAYHVGGSDRAGFRINSGTAGTVQWQCFIVDTSLTPTEFFTDLAGTEVSLDYGNITRIGSTFKTLSKALGNLANCFTDIIRYGNDGLTIEGGTTGARGTFAEIAADDDLVTAGKAYGIIRTLSSGIFGVQGALTFGLTAGTQDCYFEDNGVTVAFEDRPIADDKYYFNIEGASAGGGATYTNLFILTNSTITSAGPNVTCNFAANYIDTFTLTTVTFSNLGGTGTTITFSNSADATGHTISSCTFLSCGRVDPGDVAFTNNIFNSTTASATGAMLIDADGTANMSGLSFTSSGAATDHAIYITSPGDYTLTSFTYSGYNASNEQTNSAIYNNSGGHVNLTVSGGDSPSYLNGASATTTVISGKTIDYHVEDTDGINVQNAQVYIQKDTPTVQFAGDEYNAEGLGFIVVSSTVDADIPTSGRLTVYDKSENATLTYRYTSVDVDRLNFPAEFTGTTDSQGTSTQLIDSGADFGGADDIEEGDAIRNTTDGSWAVVDNIVSTTELRTSALRGGTNNVWGTAGDPTHDYSVNTLVTTLQSNVDSVDIPLANARTDVDGDIATISFNFQGALSVDIRIRSNEGAKKYVPFLTSGQIAGNFTGTAVIQEDLVAT